MNILKKVFLLLSLSIISLSGIARTKTSGASVSHSQAHKQLLAKAGTAMDKKVISDMVLHEISSRETKVPSLSSESSVLIEDLLKEARTHIGKRYRHGSKGPNAFDCSGFSSYVYRQFGYTISPSSRAQYLEGIPVESRKDIFVRETWCFSHPEGAAMASAMWG